VRVVQKPTPLPIRECFLYIKAEQKRNTAITHESKEEYTEDVMKTTHIILLIFLGIALFALGFWMGRTTATFYSGSSSTGSQLETGTTTDDTGSTSGTTIDASMLTDGQRKLLTSLGIDADSITVTQEMMVCAETAVGSARIQEITDGATPSFTEGVKLAGCYSSN